MKFHLLDQILDQTPDAITAIKQVSLAEEYLADHFPTFPVLPGVLMIETMAQAARRMLAPRGDERLVLGQVKALKFGAMIRPGEALRVQVTLQKELEDGAYQCKGVGTVLRNPPEGQGRSATDETAVSGRFTMRPLRSNA